MCWAKTKVNKLLSLLYICTVHLQSKQHIKRAVTRITLLTIRKIDKLFLKFTGENIIQLLFINNISKLFVYFAVELHPRYTHYRKEYSRLI